MPKSPATVSARRVSMESGPRGARVNRMRPPPWPRPPLRFFSSPRTVPPLPNNIRTQFAIIELPVSLRRARAPCPSRSWMQPAWQERLGIDVPMAFSLDADFRQPRLQLARAKGIDDVRAAADE